MRFTFKTAILIAFQLLLILVPLAWTSTTSELFEFPKMILTYAGAIIIVSLWLARMISENKFIYKRSPFELPIFLFLGSQLISTLVSIDIHTSLFGYYSRFNGGLLSLIAYAALYFAAVSNFDRTDAKVIIKTLLFSALISSLYALPEHFGHSPSCLIISGKFTANCWVQDVQNRVFGTFGQPNWLAAYLISIIFLPLSQIVSQTARQFESKRKNSLTRILPAYLTLFLFFLVLLFTKSKSGLLGFIIGLVIFSALSYISTKNNKINVLKNLGKYLILLIVTFILFGKNISGTTDKVFQLISRPHPTPVVTLTPTGPVNSLEVNITPSSDIRRIVWKGAWELAKRHPLFGTGVETFAYAYYSVRPVEHNLVSEWDFLYNKAHNEFLNFAATTGFVGLLTYLLLLGSFVLWSLTKTDSTLHALVAGYIALAISNFFGFSTVPVNTLLFLLPALAVILHGSDDKTASKPSPKVHSLNYWLIGIAGIILLAAVLRGLNADRIFTQGRAAADSKEYQVAIDKLQQAVKIAPNEALYTDELAKTASEIAVILHQSGQPDQASQAANIAIELSNRTLNLNRVHLNFYKTRTKVFLNLAAINPTFALEAGATLDAALRLAPTDAKLWFNRALLTQQMGYPKESVDIYQKAIALKPNYELARYQFGLLLDSLGDTTAAAAQYQYILDRINPDNVQAQAALAEIATRSAMIQSVN